VKVRSATHDHIKESVMRSLLVLACVAVAWPFPATAQEPAPEPLTLNAALDEALQRNPDLVALRREYEAALAVPAVDQYLAPPSFEAQIWAWPVTTLNPIRTDMYMLTVEQALPGRGKRAARAAVAALDADVERREVTVRANAILDEVRQAFAALQLARDTLVIYERQVPVLRDLAEAATVRYASGHGEQHDTVTPLVELTRLQSDAITWRTRARTEEARLNAMLGRRVDQAVEPLLPLVVTATPFDAVNAALERHPAMAVAVADIAREEAELRRLQGERRPDFVVGGGYMLMPGEAGAWTARAGITWPNAPWSRKRLDAEIEAQARRVIAATDRREAVASGIRRSVHEAQVNIDAARQRAELISTTLLPHVEHALDVSRAGYSAGRAEFGDIIDAQRMVLDVGVQYAEARAAVALALAGLDRAMGSVREEPARTPEGAQP
jgi:cobalt-zinc-cadmium efflux system outer membrane protein